MPDKNASNEKNLILGIARKIIDDTPLPSYRYGPEKINWALLKQMVIYHELAPFAYAYFESNRLPLPKEAMELFKKEHYFNFFRNLYFEQEFLRLNRIFIQEGLTMVPIKGQALLEDIYGRYPFRPMVDMDIFVREDELKKAAALLMKCGYSEYLEGGSDSYWRNENCNIPFKKDGEKCLVELHFALDLKRRNSNPLPKLWGRLRTIDANNTQIKLLSPEDTLFSLAFHQRRFGKRLCIKNTLDVALLLNKYKDGFDWDYVLKEARRDKALSTISFVLFQAKILLDTTIPQAVWKGLKVSFWKKQIMHRFIKNDTFLTGSFKKAKYVYLKSHFLLYDSLWEPISHILSITQEEFAKFYNLALYSSKTHKLYKARFLYMPYKLIKDGF